MKKIFDFRHIIIVILLLLIGLMFINPKGILPNRKELVVKTDSIPFPVHDTVPLEVEVEVEVPYEVEGQVEKIVEVPVAIKVDTAEILKIYYNKSIFDNTVKLSNNMGSVSIVDTISQNKIVGRGIKYDIKQKTKTDTIYQPEPRKTQLYVGIDAQFDKPNVVNIMGVGAVLKTKNERLYKIGAGVNNVVVDGTNGKLTPYFGGGVYWPIKLKK